jgi:molybdopterin converting factor small subunit
MRKLLILILVSFTLLQWSSFAEAASLNEAYKNQQSNVQVKRTGKVIRILSDDNQGSRHQKIILKLSSGNTILIAHNIDLAPRINSISNGDTVQFYGEYEWNNKGGVVHWTHRAPMYII